MKNKILFLLLIFSSSIAGAQVFTVDTVVYHGNPNNRINLLIMGDGYTTGEMSTFRSDAQLVANYFFSVPPFSLYQNFFNVFGIEVVSNESGTDHPGTASDEVVGSQPVTSVDNYLETTFDYGGTHRCIYSSQSSLVYSIANTNFPLYDYINVIVNTSYYGGCAGGIAYTSMNSSSPEVFVHEFGHMFGNLSDEYEYGSSSCSPGTTQYINVTQVTDPATIVWKNWLTTAPLPTPAGTNCSLIGAYEGAQYCNTDWYRPKCNCKMRSLNQSFCEVCFEQFIYKISTSVNYIESYTPSNGTTIQLCQNATQDFTAGILNSTNSTVRGQWLVDNVVRLNNGSSFTLDPSSLSPGMHQVKLIASDTTTAARKTLNNYQVVWNVNVLASPAVVAGSNGTTFCNGQTLNLSASGTGSFSWTGPSSFSSSSQNPSITGLTSAQSGTYIATATNSCGSSTSSVAITVSSSVNANIVAQGPLSFCLGNSVVLDAGANPNYSYQWYDNSGPISGAISHDYTAFQSGNYTVNVTITSTSCSATSSPVTVTANPVPVASLTSSDPLSFCDGSSALLQAQTGTGYSYQWFRGALLLGNTNAQLNAGVAGVYKVVTTLGSCRDTSGTLSIVVNPLPSNAISIGGDTVICTGDQVDLSVSSCGTCHYLWKRDTNTVASALSPDYSATQSGNYSCLLSDTITGCSATTRSVAVDVHLMPSAIITASGPATFCDGDSILLSVPSNTGTSYNWFFNAGPVPGAVSHEIYVSLSGSYTVIVSDIVCSTQSDPYTVTVQPIPSVTMQPLPDTMCIYNAELSLTGNPSGGTFSGAGVVDSSFNPMLAGTGLHAITYSYSDSTGCGASASDTIFVDFCLGTNAIQDVFSFTIYPNPTTGEARVDYQSFADEPLIFVLSDVTGREIRKLDFSGRSAGKSSFILQTYDMSPGVYILVMNRSGVIISKKLLVTK